MKGRRHSSSDIRYTSLTLGGRSVAVAFFFSGTWARAQSGDRQTRRVRVEIMCVVVVREVCNWGKVLIVTSKYRPQRKEQ